MALPDEGGIQDPGNRSIFPEQGRLTPSTESDGGHSTSSNNDLNGVTRPKLQKLNSFNNAKSIDPRVPQNGPLATSVNGNWPSTFVPNGSTSATDRATPASGSTKRSTSAKSVLARSFAASALRPSRPRRLFVATAVRITSGIRLGRLRSRSGGRLRRRWRVGDLSCGRNGLRRSGGMALSVERHCRGCAYTMSGHCGE